nr:immunoglobulin heavy chain junction region [Macaca mulatta]MOW19311.1 immunoglobulin heavy chain junction region [Macaca mulatta]MOW20201.1 immunoglobulin heavy chain junction region [Macaca mulatta]MOW21065.1 immunoglobulin heavy chain junction region [Macaca mulatta]
CARDAFGAGPDYW